MKILISIAILTSLLGCASFDKEKCNNKKLHVTGFEDAKAGKTNAKFQELTMKCQEQGITMDEAKYQQGFDKGLKEFCTTKSAFKYGLTGNTNNNTCPNGDKFAKYYDKGYAIFKIKSEIDSKATAIIEKQKQINMVKTTDREKKDFEQEIRNLKREKFELENKLNFVSKKAP